MGVTKAHVWVQASFVLVPIFIHFLLSLLCCYSFIESQGKENMKNIHAYKQCLLSQGCYDRHMNLDCNSDMTLNELPSLQIFDIIVLSYSISRKCMLLCINPSNPIIFLYFNKTLRFQHVLCDTVTLHGWPFGTLHDKSLISSKSAMTYSSMCSLISKCFLLHGVTKASHPLYGG